MLATPSRTRTVPTYCGLCAVHCPSLAVVEDQRVLALKQDSAHPFGGVMCIKGRAAPEMRNHPDRVNFPLRRTRPKTEPDPGWERCSWDQALDLIARQLLEVRETHGPQAIAFSKGTGGGTALTDTERWMSRLASYLGTPNVVSTTHLCQWPRDTGAAYYTFGTDRLDMPDVANSGCVVLWGSNPNANFLSLAADVAAARTRGARLLVVDPRRVGLANKADLLLQLRPGTDGALALCLIHLLIESSGYDETFVREWTNAPLLVREDNGMLLRVDEVATLSSDGQSKGSGLPSEAGGRRSAVGGPQSGLCDVAARADSDDLVPYDPERGVYDDPATLLLRGSRQVRLVSGAQATCRPVFERLAQLAAAYPPETAARITGVPAEQLVAAARLLADNRPVSHYFHNGLVQHTNATQASRAIEVLYALLGDYDQPGGNVAAPRPKVNSVEARGVVPRELAQRRLGRAERPIGPPARPGNITAYDLYRAILEEEPYPVKALVGFGSNTILANGDSLRGRAAFQKLAFFAQIELWHTPTSAFADVLLPAADFMESEALMLGFRYPVEAMAHVQRRQQVVEPLHERRSDVEFIFQLACRLGLGEHFWDSDVRAAYDYVLAPSGLTWEALAEHPYGVSLPNQLLRHRKYAEIDPKSGAPRGFATPTRKVELYAVPFAEHGFPPLPVYQEPAHSPVSTPELAAQYPLVFSNAKKAQYLHSQHRGLPSIRRTAPQPTAELHPDTAAQYGVADGEWVLIETPYGAARAQVSVNAYVRPGVLYGNHGWWQGCQELGLAPLDPYSSSGANINLLVLNHLHDPISGGTPHRSSLCRIRKAE